MLPKKFDIELASHTARKKGKKVPSTLEKLRKISVEFGSNLATTALRPKDAGDGNKLFLYSRISRV